MLLIVFGAVLLFALCAWLNLPGSAVAFVRSIPDQREPATFEFAFAGLPADAGNADIELLYMPQTPIFGITQHYWSIIAPLLVDRVTRDRQVAVTNGSLRFDAPLALAGLSNYRLNNVAISLPAVRTFPANFGITAIEAGRPAAPSVLPLVHADARSYAFEGSFALWQLSGDQFDGGRAFSPRAVNPTRQAIWPGLRTFQARIDLAAYPVPSFQAPVGWTGEGWRRNGINLTQPGAKLTDETVTMRAGTGVRIPFSRDCASEPDFIVVPKSDEPGWSKAGGLWAPLDRKSWGALRARRTSLLSVHFLAARSVPPDGVEAVEVQARRPGAFRLFGTCPSQHYDSLAIVWLDVTVTA